MSHQQFAESRRLVTEIDELGIAHRVVAVREKEMRRWIGVIVVHRPRRLAHAHVHHAGIAVDRSEVRAAHRLVLIQQQPRAEDAPVVIQLLGFFQGPHRLIDSILLLVHQRRVKPSRRIVRIKFPGERELFLRMNGVMCVTEGLAKVTP